MEIHLGYEVGTGKPVEIPCRHMVVCGQTQEAGKTTTLEALIARSGLPAVAFITKRGEQSFNGAHRIAPYFRERADWQFVASVLEAAMRERMKFERNWIIKASKGARTLADVQRNVKKLLETARGINEGVYTTLDAYLDIVVPRIAMVRFADTVRLQEGINVLDMSNRATFPAELQALVMRSVLEWIYENANGAITIIPEAWEFIPQGRGGPVKLSANELVRKGAGLKNFVWFDSQDIGGVDKEVLRQCPVWLLGVQRETNEIKRTLANIPSGVSKPLAAEIARLEKGQFYACWGKHVIKVYVQPAWMDEESARRNAVSGKIGKITPPATTFTRPPIESENTVTENEASLLREENNRLRDEIVELRNKLAEFFKSKPDAVVETPPRSNGVDVEALFQALLARLLKEPAVIKLTKTRPEMNVTVERKVVQADDGNLLGMIAILLSEGFLKSITTATEVWKETKRRWNYKGISARCNEQLDKLTEMGFVTKENGGYQEVAGMKVNIVKS